MEEELAIYKNQVALVYEPQKLVRPVQPDDARPQDPELLQQDNLFLREGYDAMGRHRKLFYLLDGPPYANGVLHMGHFLNKTLKDMLLRYKMLRGYSVR